ncbi:MAG: GNAT family N-acetyltransferase [Rhodothermaceae bacterium]|nr:GNAT family N-acetyltransferase [Rhodothermaceae bacterium]
MIRPITAAETRPLRAAILRPGQPPAKLVYPGDDHPDGFHAGAFKNDHLVGIATIYPEPSPEAYRAEMPAGLAFRLRGMATTPEVRGEGFGRGLLEACFAHVQANGSDLLWCNARIGALAFYQTLGLQTIGPEFDIPGIGPHYVMWVQLG